LPGNQGYRLWGLWRAVGWQIWKRTVGRPWIVRLANGMKINAYPDCVESSAAVYVRWPDRSEIEWLRDHLCEGDKVIDVGANIGLWSLLLADIVGLENLIAFEPGRIASNRLKQNFELNQISLKQVYVMALGDREDEVRFPDSESPETTASILSQNKNIPFRLVHQSALDLLDLGVSPGGVGLLKVDVEGYEAMVFRGAVEFMRNIRPKIVCFESFGPAALAKCREVLDLCGYEIKESGSVGAPASSLQNHFAFPKIISRPQESEKKGNR